MFDIPGAVRPASTTIDGKMIWIYGEPKIGKTTFANGLGNTLFMATEKGQNFVACREPWLITSWKLFREAAEQLFKTRPTHFADGQPIEWLCIDTVDAAFRMCSESVCTGLGIEDPGELPHGKGWSRLRAEFHKVMGALRSLPYGMVCLSHEARREVSARNQKTVRVQPSTGASGYDWLLGASDLIIRAYSADVPETVAGKLTGRFVAERRMQLHPVSSMVAGGRMSHILPPTLPLSVEQLRTALAAADTSSSLTPDATTASQPAGTPGEESKNEH